MGREVMSAQGSYRGTSLMSPPYLHIQGSQGKGFHTEKEFNIQRAILGEHFHLNFVEV